MQNFDEDGEDCGDSDAHHSNTSAILKTGGR